MISYSNGRWMTMGIKPVFRLALGLLVGTLLALVGTAAPAKAQSQTSQDISGYVPTSYEYKVKPTNNMTLLIRRSLQLYDKANDSLNLNSAQIVYAETNIASDIQARSLIYPDEKVQVMSDLVAKYARSAQQLDSATLAAWQKYADNARFSLSDINPTNVSLDDQGRVVNPTASLSDSSLATTPDNSTPTQNSNDWFLWFIGAGTAAILWYAFWWRQEDDKL